MSKGLEATKRLKWGYDITQEERIYLCECIEEELKRLEEYDKTEYSALIERHKELLKEKKANEKKLKALEIIKKKKVNCYLFINSENLKDYNWCVDDTKEKRLTQEEYDLLKEVLL